MIAIRAKVTAAAALTILVSGMSQADTEGFEQRDAHVHGAIVVNIAVDEGRLTIGVEAPAINVVGYEHAPRTDADRKALADAQAWLRSGRGIVGVPAAAACRLQRVKLEQPDWTADTDHKHAGHDHDHDDDGAHSDFDAQFVYDCAAAEQLEYVDLWLLKRLPGTEKATVNIVAAELQTSVTVTPDSARVALR